MFKLCNLWCVGE